MATFFRMNNRRFNTLFLTKLRSDELMRACPNNDTMIGKFYYDTASTASWFCESTVMI